MCEEHIQEFIKQRNQSLVAKLMCPKDINTKILYGENNSCYCSIVFNAFVEGHLHLLDQLLEEF
ncbi:MAG: hypothetical protein ABH871_09400 [Pseudomonadota bacterium]